MTSEPTTCVGVQPPVELGTIVASLVAAGVVARDAFLVAAAAEHLKAKPGTEIYRLRLTWAREDSGPRSLVATSSGVPGVVHPVVLLLDEQPTATT